MADTKQTKSIGEHYVAAELARRDWAPAMTRDGIERTDILAVRTNGPARLMVEIQVKTAMARSFASLSWPLGLKSQQPSLHDREFFVLLAVPLVREEPPRYFIVPRDHVAAAAWIQHMDWLTHPDALPGKRNATVDRARVLLGAFQRYEDRWDVLEVSATECPVLLPASFESLATDPRVGLPDDHPWHANLPAWTA